LFRQRGGHAGHSGAEGLIDLANTVLQSGLAQDPKKYSCRWFLQLMVIVKKSSPAN
jgi:hypothetical protein